MHNNNSVYPYYFSREFFNKFLIRNIIYIIIWSIIVRVLSGILLVAGFWFLLSSPAKTDIITNTVLVIILLIQLITSPPILSAIIVFKKLRNWKVTGFYFLLSLLLTFVILPIAFIIQQII